MNEEMQYSVRESTRARHINLKISVQHGLEIIVPQGFDLARISSILEGKREWIRNARAKIDCQKRAAGPAVQIARPERIELPALNESWRVEYISLPASSVVLRQVAPYTICLSGAVKSNTACRSVLRLWLKVKARHLFETMLADLALETGLSFRRLTIRCQTTRWGSCSRNHGVSLNLKLMFLPLPHVRHILIHELCHTRHLNHARDFWELVAKLDPDSRNARAAIRLAWRNLPAYI